MNVETLRLFYEYDRWANAQVWACVEKLSDDQFTQESDYSIGSVHNQVFHLMGSELWSLKFFGETIDDELQALKQEDFPTRKSIRSQWDGYIQRLDAGLETLTDDMLQAPINLELGSKLTGPMWHFLIAMINHGMDHRCQILALIHALGGETCEHEFWFYMMAQQKSA